MEKKKTKTKTETKKEPKQKREHQKPWQEESLRPSPVVEAYRRTLAEKNTAETMTDDSMTAIF